MYDFTLSVGPTHFLSFIFILFLFFNVLSIVYVVMYLKKKLYTKNEMFCLLFAITPYRTTTQ